MDEYNFYYDESEHSRKINTKTIMSNNYYDKFVTAIVGWKSDDENEIYSRYEKFLNKYSYRENNYGEIKSSTIKPNNLKYGFASLSKKNTLFIDDFLSLVDNKIQLFFSTNSKIEYIINQLFEDNTNNRFNMQAIKYSLTKILVIYRPENVINDLCDFPENFVNSLKSFMKEKILLDLENIILKTNEIETYNTLISTLDDVNTVPNVEWNYNFAFEGFKKYLKERNIVNYNLYLDNEGSTNKNSPTKNSALDIGLKNVEEVESYNEYGIQIADIIAGLVTKFLKSLSNSLGYESLNDSINKKILPKQWFQISDDQLLLYKKLCKIVCCNDKSWYKSYSGIYSDDLIVFITFLKYISHFNSTMEIKNRIELHGEIFNSIACEQIKNKFE